MPPALATAAKQPGPSLVTALRGSRRASARLPSAVNLNSLTRVSFRCIARLCSRAPDGRHEWPLALAATSGLAARTLTTKASLIDPVVAAQAMAGTPCA